MISTRPTQRHDHYPKPDEADSVPMQNLPNQVETNAIAEQTFAPKTDSELFYDILAATDATGHTAETIDYSNQPSFTRCAHTVLNNYYMNRHRSEWEAGTKNAIARPLPLQWVSSRIDTYYASVHKGSDDRVHQGTILNLRNTHTPTAQRYAQALPEIASAFEIKSMFEQAGHKLAADAMSDLLVVYGITLHFLQEKQRQQQQLKQEIAARAIQHTVKTTE
ncbi:hypothetical protein H7Y63_02170 [Polaromonas sp.]|nr:hypothetical protein [Candidatus Saccharibacteria bacterium]